MSKTTNTAPLELASPEQVAAMMAQKDETELTAALMGEAAEEWFYEFQVGDKTIEGVGVTGAMEFARIRGEQGFPIRFPVDNIRVEEVTEHGELGVRATVVARDARGGHEGVGVAFYPWYEGNGDGGKQYDDKAGRKAVSVAKRNAVLDLIPAATIVQVLKVRKELSEINAARQQRELDDARPARVDAPLRDGKEAQQLGEVYEQPVGRLDQGRRFTPQPVTSRTSTALLASEGQRQQLLQLVFHPAIAPAIREKVQKRLSTGLPEGLAATWIEQLDREVQKHPPVAAEASADDDNLGL